MFAEKKSGGPPPPPPPPMLNPALGRIIKSINNHDHPVVLKGIKICVETIGIEV